MASTSTLVLPTPWPNLCLSSPILTSQHQESIKKRTFLPAKPSISSTQRHFNVVYYIKEYKFRRIARKLLSAKQIIAEDRDALKADIDRFGAQWVANISKKKNQHQSGHTCLCNTRNVGHIRQTHWGFIGTKYCTCPQLS